MSTRQILWMFIFLITLVSANAWVNCTPDSCHTDYVDNGLICKNGLCTRNCTLRICDNSTWTEVQSNFCQIWEDNDDEEACSIAGYTPTDNTKCVRYNFYAGDTTIMMDVTDPINPDCDSHAVAGFTTSPPYWFENLTGYHGDVTGTTFDYWIRAMWAVTEGEDTNDYKDTIRKPANLYCAPNRWACDDIADYGNDCDIGCYNKNTAAKIFQGYLKDKGDNETTLYDTAGCDGSNVPYNKLRDNYLKVYTADTIVLSDDQTCERTNEAPTVSNVGIIPMNPTAGDNLYCNFTYFDEEKYEEKNSTYEWYKNGINQNINSYKLNKENLSVNDVWQCKVSPSDGLLTGTQQSSSNVTIGTTIQNLEIKIGDYIILNQSGYYSDDEYIIDFNEELNNALETCTPDAEGYCNITLSFSSDSTGILNISNLEIFHEELPPKKVYSIQNSSSQNVAIFNEIGSLILSGTCTQSATCTPPSDSYIFKDTSNNVVSYIDPSGNLCIETGDCSDNSASCIPTNDAFRIQDNDNNDVAYIDLTNGDLCLTGTLTENGNP